MEEKSVMLWMMMMKCFGAESASEVPSQKVKYHLPTLQGPYVNTLPAAFTLSQSRICTKILLSIYVQLWPWETKHITL